MNSPSAATETAKLGVKGWLVCLVAFSLLYLATCQRGVSWQDGGWYQLRVLEGDYRGTGNYAGDWGLAVAHPLYIAAARAFAAIPLGTLAGRVNFFSGLGMAIALANLAAIVTLLTGRRWIGVATAAMLSVAHTVWWLSTVAEVYTWSAAALTVELMLLVSLLLRPRWTVLIGLAFTVGVHWSIHNVALLAIPVYAATALALVVRRRLPAWAPGVAAVAFFVGAGPYVFMIVWLAVETGDPAGAVRSALVGQFTSAVTNVSWSASSLKVNAALASLNFVSFLLPLAVCGWVSLRRVTGLTVAAALGAITLIEVVFVARYNVADQFTFLLPSLVMVALAAGVGLKTLGGQTRRRTVLAMAAAGFSIVLPPIFYATGPAILRAARVEVHRGRTLPFRDEVRYWLVPWKQNEDSAERFTRTALAEASPEGVIVTDGIPFHALLFTQKSESLAPGVTVTSRFGPLPAYDKSPEEFRTQAAGRAVYLVSPGASYAPRNLEEDAEVSRPNGAVLYRVRWNAAKTGPDVTGSSGPAPATSESRPR
ncbi:MAG TPA: hypothetical protein DCX07_08385 [Phycisphaerales bacterium]|nr:hypothetical protein [Phycisphaerales bacterium]